MRKRLLAGTVLAVLSVGSWKAFGFGDIVHDPISYANALLMLAQIIRNYEQLQAQYDLQVWDSTPVPLDMSSVYRVPGAPWYELQLPSDHFGRLSTWLQAVNAAGSAWDGYATASIALREFGPNLSKMSIEEQGTVGSRYASVELTDATNIHSMETLGMLRVNAEAADASLQAIEDNALSSAPEMNTEKAILNNILAASVGALRLSRDANRLTLSTLEQQVVESKRRRDAEASELNDQISRLERGDEAKAQHTQTLGQALQSFRWR